MTDWGTWFRLGDPRRNMELIVVSAKSPEKLWVQETFLLRGSPLNPSCEDKLRVILPSFSVYQAVG
jgi:hypothetical protein